MYNKKKILSGISVDYIGSIIATIVGFAVVPFYFNYISTEEFGLWLAIAGLSALITMVDLGTDQYLTTVTASDEKFYADSYADYLTSILFIKTIVSFLLGFIGVVMYLFLTQLLDIELLYIDEAKIAFLIGVVILVIGGYFSTISTILYARHHYSLINSFVALFAILTSLGTVLLLHFGFGIISFPLSLLITTIVQHIILFIYLMKNYPHIRLKIRNFHFIDKKEIIGYTTTFQILRWVHTLRTQYITIAINNLAGPIYVAQYNLTNKIPQMVPSYAVKIVHPFFPSIADLFHKGDIEKIREIFIKISKVLFRLALFFSIAIYFLNESFVHLWVGSDKFAGSIVVLWLVIYMFHHIALGIFGIIIFASKQFEKWTMWSLVDIGIAITLSYILFQYFELVGIVAGIVIGSFFSQGYLFYIVLKQLKIRILIFVKKIFIYTLVPNIAPFFIAYTIFPLYKIDSWILFFVSGAILVLSSIFSWDTIRYVSKRSLV